MPIDHPPDPHAIQEAWRRELPGVPTRSIPVVAAAKRAATVLRQARERALRDRRVDAATLDLLSTLRRAGPPYTLSTRELSERCLVTAGAISQRLARAAREGLVMRNPAAGRRVEVTLTKQGHRVVEECAGHVLEVDETLIDGLSEEEIAELERLLSRWLKVMDC